jgi:hypothetical protein
MPETILPLLLLLRPAHIAIPRTILGRFGLTTTHQGSAAADGNSYVKSRYLVLRLIEVIGLPRGGVSQRGAREKESKLHRERSRTRGAEPTGQITRNTRANSLCPTALSIPRLSSRARPGDSLARMLRENGRALIAPLPFGFPKSRCSPDCHTRRAALETGRRHYGKGANENRERGAQSAPTE